MALNSVNERHDVTHKYLNASTCLDLPPPIPCGHLAVYSIPQLLILIVLLRCVFHPILECRVPNQLTHTLNRIPSPELNFLDDRIAVLVLAVSSDFKDFTFPLWALGETINFLEERMLVSSRWASTGLNLDEDSTLRNWHSKRQHIPSPVLKTCQSLVD